MSTAKPNFIVIFPDQWRGDCLSCLDHEVVETPYLDHIAAEGWLFTSAYSAAPTCIPARASLATGQTPSTHGRIGYQDGVPWNYQHTLMHCLRDGGYQTLNAGKTHFYPQRAALGFEEMRLYEIPIHHPDFESDYHVWLQKQTDGAIEDIARGPNPNSWVVNPWVHDINLHPTTWTMDAALDLIWRRDPQRPFFLQIGFHRPHAPYDPPVHYYEQYANSELPPVPVGDWVKEPEGDIRKTDGWEGRLSPKRLARMRQAYYAQMSHIDFQIGRLYFYLNKKGLLRNTYVIFLSDHGELLGDHHLLRKGKPFEGSAKIPMIIRCPNDSTLRTGGICNLPVSHMDIMPTLLEAAGLTIPNQVEGSSLLPIMSGSDHGWREFLHGEHASGNIGWQYLTDGKQKYIWETASGDEWFFDLTIDTQELTNRIDDQAYAKETRLWRERLINILAKRPADGLSDGTSLTAGRVLPNVRESILNS